MKTFTIGVAAGFAFQAAVAGALAGCGGAIDDTPAGAAGGAAGADAGAPGTGDPTNGDDANGSSSPSPTGSSIPGGACPGASRVTDVADVGAKTTGVAAMAVDETHVYWLSVGGAAVGGFALERAPKCGGGAAETLLLGVGVPGGLAVTSAGLVVSSLQDDYARLVVQRVPKAGGPPVRLEETLYGPHAPTDLTVDGAFAYVANADVGVERVPLEPGSTGEFGLGHTSWVAYAAGAVFGIVDGAVVRMDATTRAQTSTGPLLATDVRLLRAGGNGSTVYAGGQYVWTIGAADLAVSSPPRTAGWAGSTLGMAVDGATVYVTAATAPGGHVALFELDDPSGDKTLGAATPLDPSAPTAPVALDTDAVYWPAGATVVRIARR